MPTRPIYRRRYIHAAEIDKLAVVHPRRADVHTNSAAHEFYSEQQYMQRIRHEIELLSMRRTVNDSTVRIYLSLLTTLLIQIEHSVWVCVCVCESEQ